MKARNIIGDSRGSDSGEVFEPPPDTRETSLPTQKLDLPRLSAPSFRSAPRQAVDTRLNSRAVPTAVSATLFRATDS